MGKIYNITEENLSKIISEAIKNNINNNINGLYEFTEETDFIKYADEVWTIMQNSYSHSDGFLTYSTKEEMIAKTSLLIAYFNDNHIIACAIYKDTLGGQKLVGCGTPNGKKEDKKILKNIIKNDIENFKLWHWAEVSYPLEKWFKEMGGNPIPSEMSYELLHMTSTKKRKEIEIIDEVHYKRLIKGKIVTKAIYGFKDEETYNAVMEKIEDYVGFKNIINNMPQITESVINDKNISKAMEIIIQLDNLSEEGFDEITQTMYDCLIWAINVLSSCKKKDKRIENMIRNGEYMLKNFSVLSCNNFNDYEQYITSPAI